MAIRHLCQVVTLCAMVTVSVFSNTVLGNTVSAPGQNNCDIRQFNLTPTQKNKMRLIRVQYRNTLNNFHHLSNNQSSNGQLAKILMHPNFDETRVRHYILDRYAERMQQDVNELKVQYTFLQILNQRQRQSWINNCLQ